MKTKLKIETLKTQKQYRELAKILTKEQNKNLDIYPKRLSMTSMGLVEIGAISGIVAATVTVAQFVYTIYKDIQNKTKKWNLEELKSIVETECAKSGLVNIKITDISNFKTLLESNGLTCIVTVQTEKDEIYQIHVSKSGYTFIIK